MVSGDGDGAWGGQVASAVVGVEAPAAARVAWRAAVGHGGAGRRRVRIDAGRKRCCRARRLECYGGSQGRRWRRVALVAPGGALVVG